MLRVEASNLPNPRGAPRPRRLLPNPPGVKRRAGSAARHELPPPADPSAPVERTLGLAPPAPVAPERWSVRLELKDDDIAKLYGQGMTRGAVVWKKGMVEWRPLLVTPELTTLLRRTRTTLTELTSSPLAAEELTLPRPARLPSDVAAAIGPATAPAALPAPAPLPTATTSYYPAQARFTTVAPTALDVEREPASPRRRIELAAVAIGAFALAWITHGRLSSHDGDNVRTAASLLAAAPAPAAPACEPARAAVPAALETPASTIRTVSLSDLPVAGGRASSGVTTASVGGGSVSRGRAASTPAARSASAPAPTRAELAGALSQVARAASGCGERSGPVRVVMSFASSGVARSIQVSGAGLPAQTRSCIIGAASRARVPAFSGDPVTVSKSL